MTEKEYREHPAVSRSELWKISESPEKFKYYKDHPEKPTPSLVFGQLFHKLVLEPETIDEEFAIIPEVDRRTKESKLIWQEFVENNQNKILVSTEDYNKATEMCTALRNAPFVNKLLSGEHEKEFFWFDDLTGEECKCRLDCLTKTSKINIIVDIKTSSDASTEHFMKDAINYGYDFQAGMYTEGVTQCTNEEYIFVFIVIEKEPPYAVNILQADTLFIKRGYDLFREYIGIYHDCKSTGDWYGYLGKFKVINSLALPAWLSKEIE